MPNRDQIDRPDTDPAGVGLAVALRLATAARHAAIEELPFMRHLMSPEVTRDDYRRYLRRFGGIYAEVEPGLFAGLDPALRERLGLRPKLPALLQDLAEQGERWTPTAARGAESSSPGGVAAIIGGLYVLEGATLGGRTIARHLRRCLGDELGGARLLDFHGEQTSAAWKRFAALLDDLCAEGLVTPSETIAGACATFDRIYASLVQAESPDGECLTLDPNHAERHLDRGR